MRGRIRVLDIGSYSDDDAARFSMLAGRANGSEPPIRRRAHDMTTICKMPTWILTVLCAPCLAVAQAPIDEIEVVASSPLGDSRVDELGVASQ